MQQLKQITKFMSWNGFPKHVRKSILARLKTNSNTRERLETPLDDPKPTIWIRVPYSGEKGKQLVWSLTKKIKRSLKLDVKFKIFHQCKKLSMFCSAKDKIHDIQKSNVIYKIRCPGCNGTYIGKTDRCLITRLKEHGSKPDQPMYQHLFKCQELQDTVNPFFLPDMDIATSSVNINLHIYNAVINNTNIIDYNNNWSQLEFLEVYHIKKHMPSINYGLKASRELQLFR